jgi:hypothetical protein
MQRKYTATHTECFDEQISQYILSDPNPFGFNNLTYITDVEASKALNTKPEHASSYPHQEWRKQAASCITSKTIWMIRATPFLLWAIARTEVSVQGSGKVFHRSGYLGKTCAACKGGDYGFFQCTW